jgi:hypothetical protein
MKINLILLFIVISKCSFSQNVGIGTSVPLSKLHINGTNESLLRLNENGTLGAQIGFYQNGLARSIF